MPGRGRGLRRIVALLAVLVVAGIVTFAIWWARAGDEGVKIFYMQTSYNLTGNEDLDRAFKDLPEATAMRVHVMGQALQGLFIDLPREEKNNTEVATIRLNNDIRGGVTGLPFEHFLFEWTDPPAMPNPFEKIRVQPISASVAEGTSNRVRVQIIQDDASNKRAPSAGKQTSRIQVQSVLEQVDENGSVTPIATCETVYVDLENKGVSLVNAVDGLAACILMHFIQETVKSPPVAFKRDKDARHAFEQAYKPILEIGDSKRQRQLLSGIEKYYTYARTWSTQPADADQALKDAVFFLHKAAEGDDRNEPRYAIGEYLFVHAASAEKLGPLNTIARKAEHKNDSNDLSFHVELVFKTWPFACARWSRAVAYQALKRQDDAQKAWEAVQSPPDDACKSFERGKRYEAYKRMAKRQVVNANWYSGDVAGAMQARCQAQGIELPREMSDDGNTKSGSPTPTMTGSPDTSSVATVPPALSGTHGTEPRLSRYPEWQCAARMLTCQKPPEAPDAGAKIKHAAALFERAIDYVLMEGMAYNVAEVVPFHQGLVQLAEHDIRPLRRAATEASCLYQFIDYPATARLQVDLNDRLASLDATLADCKAGSPDCEPLRGAVEGLATTVAQLARQRANSTLEAARAELDVAREELCAGLDPQPKECVTVKPAKTDSGAPAPTGSGTSTPEGCGAQSEAPGSAAAEEERPRRDHLAQAFDLEARIAMLAIDEECKDAAASKSAPKEKLAAIRRRNLRLLHFSKYRDFLQQEIASCGVMLLAGTRRSDLIAKERMAHLTEAWAWAPPDAKLTFDAEEELREELTSIAAPRSPASKPSPAPLLFRYATILPAIDRYVALEESNIPLETRAHEILGDAANQNAAWKDTSKALASLWDVGVGGPNMRETLGTIGEALAWEVARRTENVGDNQRCYRIAAMAACGLNKVDLPSRCSISKQECIFDESRKAYEGWASKLTPKSSGEAVQAVEEGRRKIVVASAAFHGLADQGVAELLAAFNQAFGDPQTSVPDEYMTNGSIRLGALLTAAKLRQAKGDVVGSISFLGPRAFQAVINKPRDFDDEERNENAGDRAKMRQWFLVSSSHVVEELQRVGISFEDAETHDAISSLDEAVRLLNKKPRKCWAQEDSAVDKNRRWARRFFGHVALNIEAYTPTHAIDRQRIRHHDLAQTYDAWCSWGATDGQPLVVDEDVLALSWLWQDRFKGKEHDRHTVLSGDALGAYMYRRALGRRGDFYFRPNDPEALLLQAEEAFLRRDSRLAFDFAQSAVTAFRGQTLRVLDGRDEEVLFADTKMLVASRARSGSSYLNAWLTYDALPGKMGQIQKFRAVAALLELQRTDEARSMIMSSQSKCGKARLLESIILWRRGQRDEARAETSKAGLSFADMESDLDDPGCPNEAAGPVFLGPRASEVARIILFERSSK